MARMLGAWLVFAAIFSSTLSKEIADPPYQERYVSGQVHQEIMDRKHAFWADEAAAGLFNSSRFQAITEFTPCVDGKSRIQFKSPRLLPWH